MTVAIFATAALVGRLSRSLPFAVWLLLAPGLAYTASPHWVRIHVWGGLFGVHYGRHARRTVLALSAPTPKDAAA